MPNNKLNAFAFLLMAPFAHVVAARADQDPVAIEQEPRHRLKFENEHVRFFDAELEPGYVSLYHWHTNVGHNVSHAVDIRIKR